MGTLIILVMTGAMFVGVYVWVARKLSWPTEPAHRTRRGPMPAVPASESGHGLGIGGGDVGGGCGDGGGGGGGC